MSFEQFVLGNAATAALLALIAIGVSRIARQPVIAHLLWLLVLVKLVTPPIWDAPVLPEQLSVTRRTTTPHVAIRGSGAGLLGVAPPSGATPQGSTLADGGSSGASAAVEPASVAPPVIATEAPASVRTGSLPGIDPRDAAVAVWVTGVAVLALVALRRSWSFSRSLGIARPATTRVQAVADEVAARLGLRVRPAVLAVPARVPPLLWAFGRARVLIPASFEWTLDADELRAVLAHELAHYRRRDHWVRWFELGVVTLWWWFPLAWWARHELRLAEEECCDSWAKWALSGDGEPCANALLKTLDWLAAGPAVVPAAASGIGHFHALKRRLTMILQVETGRSLPWSARAMLGALAVAALAFTPTPGQSTAQPQAPQEKPAQSAVIERALDALALPKVPRTAVPSDKTVAVIDGVAARSIDLMRVLIELNGPILARELAMLSVARSEAANADVVVTDAEIDAAAREILRGADLPAEPISDGVRTQAETMLLWTKLAARAGIQPKGGTGAASPATSRGGDPDQIRKQLYIREVTSRYDVRVRGDGSVSLPEGVWARTGTEAEGIVDVTTDDVVRALQSLTTAPVINEAREMLIGCVLLGNALGGSSKSVTAAEVSEYAAGMNAKYKAPFDWRMICQLKGTSIGAECVRFRQARAMTKLSGFDPTPKDLKDFYEENRAYFDGEHRFVSHILFRTNHAVTGATLPGAEAKGALAKTAWTRLSEGADFATLAKSYSEDPATATTGGALAQPVKQLDRNRDPVLRDAAWKLAKPGDFSAPIRTNAGWEIIRLDKIVEGKKGIDPTQPTYSEWIREEFTRSQTDGLIGIIELASGVQRPDLTGAW